MKLNIKEGYQSNFAKDCQVSLASRTKVNELQKAGTSTKVDHINVPVVKMNNIMRICKDFKTTLNPALKIDQYPLYPE